MFSKGFNNIGEILRGGTGEESYFSVINTLSFFKQRKQSRLKLYIMLYIAIMVVAFETYVNTENLPRSGL